MNAQALITDLQPKGVKFELDGDGFRVRAPFGLITPELREELAAAKPEILILLKQRDTEINVSHIAGDCPHCKAPLLVFTHPLDDEVWVQCPTRPELFKALKHKACEWCRDCAEKLTVIAGRCAECVQRVILAPDAPCSTCGSLRFWRHRASSDKPAGFLWRCANCEEPSGKVALYEIEGGV
jgi:hypothetical protein